MVFSSTVFIFVFLPITLLGYFAISKKYRNIWLLAVSFVFFCWSQPRYFWIILLSIVINYIGARLIGRVQSRKKLVMLITVVADIVLLVYFKYFDFLIESINAVTNGAMELKHIILPIGISFFSFQGISYVIDVYREVVPAQKSIIKLGVYIMLFPQLIAGPIVRYKDVAEEIDNRQETLIDFCSGIERFIIGLAKKVIIANTMAAMADAIWNNGIEISTALITWVGSLAYTLQIYFDFSGYSDMAIGLGRMFGFHFNENFNLPYIAESISDFWRRWHISLSSWFKDYVYIPLGGNRRHVYINLLIVFALTGIWHGASWHFVVWGVWNGAFILLERFWKNNHSSHEQMSSMKRVMMKIYTLLVVNFGWVFFRANSTGEAIQFIGTMLGLVKPEKIGFSVWWYWDRWNLVIMLVGIIFASSIPSKISKGIKSTLSERGQIIGKNVGLIVLLFFSMVRIVAGTYNPFIYFQF